MSAAVPPSSVPTALEMRGIRELFPGVATLDGLRIKTTNLDRPVAFLSGGNQQKVVLGKWPATEADILIFDKPTRGVDVGAKQGIYALMNRPLRRRRHHGGL